MIVNLAPVRGTASGPVSYTVLPNTGAARTTTISTIGGPFEIRQAAGSATTPPPVSPPPVTNDTSVLGVQRTCTIPMTTVKSGANFKVGTYVLSPSRQYKLIYQTDGNLVLYRASGEFLWNNGKVNTGGRLTMQTDGNLVSYNAAGKALWATGTHGKPGAVLGVQDDGNVVIQPKSGCTPLWKAR
jgi:hypothetical protein